jgi:hypothetical protein
VTSTRVLVMMETSTMKLYRPGSRWYDMCCVYAARSRIINDGTVIISCFMYVWCARSIPGGPSETSDRNDCLIMAVVLSDECKILLGQILFNLERKVKLNSFFLLWTAIHRRLLCCLVPSRFHWS